MTTPGITAAPAFGARSVAVHAVRNVTLEARPGRVTGLVGPNGSGKTTLLLMLSSLLAPDAGEIRIGGIDPRRRPAGRAGASSGGCPTRSARGARSPPARRSWSPRACTGCRGETRRRARGRRCSTQVGLTDLADAPARVLSRGQKQRLGLARALVHDPHVLLLDEPASGLDPQARIDLRTLLRRFAAEGRTILVSSHVLSELEEVVDDAVFLVRGRDGRAGPRRGGRAAARARGASASPELPAAEAAASVAGALRARPRARCSSTVRTCSCRSRATPTRSARSRALVAAGVPVAEFAPATGSLEHTFLDLGAAAARGCDPAPTAARVAARRSAHPDRTPTRSRRATS